MQRASDDTSAHVMSSGVESFHDEVERTIEQLSNGVDRDTQWLALSRWLRPYEADRAVYRSSRYARPVVLQIDAHLWQRLMSVLTAQGALDLMLLFGCAPMPNAGEGIDEWVHASCARESSIDVRFRVLLHDNPPKVVTFDETSQRKDRDRAGDADVATCGGHDGGVTEVNVTTASDRIRELENEVRELTKQLRLLRSRDVVAPASGQCSSHTESPIHLQPNANVGSRLSPGATSAASGAAIVPPSAADRLSGVPNTMNICSSAVSVSSVVSSSTALHPTAPCAAVSLAASTSVPPVPQIVVHGKSLVASTAGGSIVCVPLNYLDPDVAPYVVGLHVNQGAAGGGSSSLQLVPCSIVEHRFVMFVAPPQPRGSVAVTILCTKDGSLRRYTKSTWLEYRPPEQSRTVLSYHAVNQLMQEVPLPSSATADPSENATTDFKSEADDDVADDAVGSREGDEREEEELLDGDDVDVSDDDCSVITSNTATTTLTAASVVRAVDGVPAVMFSSAPRQQPAHLPLTRAMLELFQPYSVFGGPPAPIAPMGAESRGQPSERASADGDEEYCESFANTSASVLVAAPSDTSFPSVRRRRIHSNTAAGVVRRTDAPQVHTAGSRRSSVGGGGHECVSVSVASVCSDLPDTQ